jgi:hypothetical protein
MPDFGFGGSHGQASHGSTASERRMRHVGQGRLTFCDIFTAVGVLVSFVAALIGVRWRRQALAMRLAAVR